MIPPVVDQDNGQMSCFMLAGRLRVFLVYVFAEEFHNAPPLTRDKLYDWLGYTRQYLQRPITLITTLTSEVAIPSANIRLRHLRFVSGLRREIDFVVEHICAVEPISGQEVASSVATQVLPHLRRGAEELEKWQVDIQRTIAMPRNELTKIPDEAQWDSCDTEASPSLDDVTLTSEFETAVSSFIDGCRIGNLRGSQNSSLALLLAGYHIAIVYPDLFTRKIYPKLIQLHGHSDHELGRQIPEETRKRRRKLVTRLTPEAFLDASLHPRGH